MVLKVYVSGISGNKEVKKRQQRVLMILDSRTIKYDLIDIAEPGNEEEKDFMHSNSTSPGAIVSDTSPRHPLPPQIFNDNVYCGDYDEFDMANEVDELEKFLKLAPDDTAPILTSNAEIELGNGNLEDEVKQVEGETKQEVLETAVNTLENDIVTEKEEQSPQTESESIEKTNGEVKLENEDKSVAAEES